MAAVRDADRTGTPVSSDTLDAKLEEVRIGAVPDADGRVRPWIRT